LSNSLINKNYPYVLEEGYLRFKVINGDKNNLNSQEYTLKMMITDKLSLSFGKLYSTKLD